LDIDSSAIVHKWQHITQQWKQITVCVMRKILHVCPPQPFTPDYTDIPYRCTGQVPKNSTIETTAVSLHKRQLCNRITTSKKHKTLLIRWYNALLLLVMSAWSSPVTEIIWPKWGQGLKY